MWKCFQKVSSDDSKITFIVEDNTGMTARITV